MLDSIYSTFFGDIIIIIIYSNMDIAHGAVERAISGLCVYGCTSMGFLIYFILNHDLIWILIISPSYNVSSSFMAANVIVITEHISSIRNTKINPEIRFYLEKILSHCF